MADVQSPKAPRMRQARKSIAHLPSVDRGGEKENATLDSVALSAVAGISKGTSKKSRSKSLGPGGLDALKEGTGNKGAPSPRQVKSILKPTIPISPLRAIPPRNASSTGSPSKNQGRRTPDKSPSRTPKAPQRQDLTMRVTSGQSPSRSPARVALRTEEQQQAAVKEKERQDVLAHKDARRKSLANRRVSFAPEATLHTWNVVELPEDSTTSSASTNSTRRASGLTANHGSPFPGSQSPVETSDASEPPSTPPEQIEEMQVAASPAKQRDLHQKKRRRSSAIPPMNFNDPAQLSSSPFSGDSADETESQMFETADEGSDSSDSDKDLVEDETVTNIDGDDNTLHSSNSTGSSGRLNAALEQAARQAGTQGMDIDEHGDATMEIADEEITEAFKPWLQENRSSRAAGDPSALLDQENVNPFSPAFKAIIPRIVRGEPEDETMEITRAVGGILSAGGDTQSSPKRRRRKSIAAPKKGRNSVARRRSSGSSVGDDQTMDLTTAIGGIEGDDDRAEGESIDEQTMELTTSIGGIQESVPEQGDDLLGDDEELTMEFTSAAGGILLPSITERTEPPEDQTMEMDVTAAIGNILPAQLSTGSKTVAKMLMEREVDAGQLSVASPFHDGSAQKPKGAGLLDERPLPAQTRKGAVSSETGSPSLAAANARGSARKSVGQRQSLTPKSRQPTPVNELGTPSKQMTPQPIRPTTPGKTPPSKNVNMRSASPIKLFEAEINTAKEEVEATTPASTRSSSLFHHDPTTGKATPSVVLNPRKRRSSGLGIDREGLGSPRVTALLDRRGSIGENARSFVPHVKPAGIRFKDPRIWEQEVDQEREQDRWRESGHDSAQYKATSQDFDEEKDATTNLKEMIESLTPQKKKMHGRKSLHIGAAKGILGKRPAELDEEDNEGDDSAANWTKSREGSPVKKVKLPAPPSKAATTGRATRSTRRSLVETSGNVRLDTPTGSVSPSKQNTTLSEQTQFKDAEAANLLLATSFSEKVDDPQESPETAGEEDRIQLQEFLNMTSIRFMELTTTKRRHTVAPNALEQSIGKGRGVENASQVEPTNELESCVVAGACTAPMLELYQHSCRELKNYISEGRKVAKEIEEATFEDNPPLFREYMSAPPDIKLIMDNQFKNVKTNARLLSKAMWYEWRMKLLDGLKEGLMGINQDMEADVRSLTQQEQILQPVLPALMEEHDNLENQLQTEQDQADELAGCDQDELRESRGQLMDVESDLEEKRQMIEDLQNQLRQREDSLEEALSQKHVCVREIAEAEKVRQDCRGWSSGEVGALQSKISAIEASHGWAISSATDSALCMVYNRTLQLFFTPACFQSKDSDSKSAVTENAPISLTYVADAHEYHSEPLTTERRFFLQIIRAQLQCLQQSKTRPKDLLAFIAQSWDRACSVTDETKALDVDYVTEPTIIADEIMAVRSVIFLRAMKTKVEVSFEVKVRSGEGVTGIHTIIKPTAKVCYGEALNEKKMSEFLESRSKGVKGFGVWAQATKELEERLIARGKKE